LPSFYFIETFSGHSGFLATSYGRPTALRESERLGAATLAPKRRKKRGEKKMRAKALIMLVSAMFLAPTARLYPRN
jgi:hypothetical protein